MITFIDGFVKWPLYILHSDYLCVQHRYGMKGQDMLVPHVFLLYKVKRCLLEWKRVFD